MVVLCCGGRESCCSRREGCFDFHTESLKANPSTALFDSLQRLYQQTLNLNPAIASFLLNKTSLQCNFLVIKDFVSILTVKDFVVQTCD